MQWLLDAIKDVYDKFVATFQGWYQDIVSWFWNLYNNLVSTLYKWYNQLLTYFWSVIDYCVGLVWDACVYIYNIFLGDDGFVWSIFGTIISYCETALESMPNLSAIVQQYRGSFDFVMVLVGRLDQFFPMKELGALLTSYFIFVVCFLIVKWVLKVVRGG